MTTTRTTTSPGVFGLDATTVIPGSPTLGVAYRNTAATQQDAEDGWAYGTRVDSAKFNQILFQATSLLKILDTQGVLGWCNTVDYPVGAIVLGSDAQQYRATLASGPSGAGAQDPTTPSAYWVRWGAAAASSAEVAAGTVADKYVSPATLLGGLLGVGSLGLPGYFSLPVNVGGVLRKIIIQWGRVSGLSNDSSASVALPIPFPNAFLLPMASVDRASPVAGSFSAYASVGSLSTIIVTGDSATNGATDIAAYWLAVGW